MNRKIFFLLEKLKITPKERTAVSLLLLCLFTLALVNVLWQPTSPFNDDDYSDLEEEFIRRTRALQEKEQALMARYFPTPDDAEVPGSTAFDTLYGNEGVESISQAQTDTSKININTAPKSALLSLPGIGPVYAERIITYRQENGSFLSFQDLLKIKGIGKKRLEKLLPFIQLSDSTINQ